MTTPEPISPSRVLAFSGSRTIPPAAELAVEAIVGGLQADLFVTGACVGIDQYVATSLAARYAPQAQRIIVPGDLSRVNAGWLLRIAQEPGVEVVRMPRWTTYRDRNEALLGADEHLPNEFDPCRPDVLYAFPMFAENDPRSRRSGTWQTVRLARERGIDVAAFLLCDLAFA